MELVTEKIVTVNEAFELLKNRRVKVGALSYEQQNTFDYLEDLIRLTDKNAASMKSELTKIGLNEECAVRIVNLLPKKEEELKLTLGDQINLNEDVLKKTLEISKSYLKDAKEPAKIKRMEAPQTEATQVNQEDNTTQEE